MKIRKGFVSNSSSSSFLIVGISGYTNPELMKQFMEAEKKEVCSFKHGQDWGDLINFYGLGYGVKDPSGVRYAGISIEDLMENRTLPEIKKYFQEMVLNTYKIKIPDEVIKLFYGEMGE